MGRQNQGLISVILFLSLLLLFTLGSESTQQLPEK